MKKTVGDRIIDFYHEYIAISKKKKVNDTTKDIITYNDYSPYLQKSGYKKLTPEKRRLLSQQCPILMKGIKKKNLDTFRAWFKIETLKDRGSPISMDIRALREFEKRANYKAKLYEAGVCSEIYGDGFLLIIFTDDEKKDLKDPVDKNSEPWNVQVLNPEKINEMAYINKENKKKGLLHYVYKKGVGKDEYIHPDRVQHIVSNKLPASHFGLSKIDLLRHTLESKKNIDIAAGRILSWFSHGILDLKWDGMTQTERKEMMKIANQHPSAWVHDEDVEVDIKNPEAIDPKPFYDYVVLNIAAALNMPTHILTGIQTGRVTGSEIGFGDYYRDVHDKQELIYTPLIEALYKRIIEARGRTWKYRIIWNPIYIDETTEAKLLKSRIEAVEKALNCGVIDKKEGRKIINEGLVELDIEKEIQDKPPLKPKNPQPPQPPEPNRKQEEKLSKEEQDMIERCKKAMEAQAEKERELGKKILKEQEEEDENKD